MIIVFVLLVFAAYFVMKVFEGEKDYRTREDFRSTENIINGAYAAIEHDLSELNLKQTNNKCTRANLKSEQGPLICSTSISFTLLAEDIEDAQKLAERIHALTGLQKGIDIADETPNLLAAEEEKYPGSSLPIEARSGFSIAQDMSCSIVFRFLPSTKNEGISDVANNSLYTNIGCNARAKNEIYPSE